MAQVETAAPDEGSPGEGGKIVLARRGQSALRLRGRQVREHLAQSAGGADLAIRLWETTSGGLAVSATVPLADGGLGPDAARCGSFSEAADWLEGLCREVACLPAPALAGPDGAPVELMLHPDRLFESVIRLQTLRDQREAFLWLAGEAMAAWLAPPPPQMNRMPERRGSIARMVP